MGRLMRRAPKYVHGFIDRHGKSRFYFRRPGFKKLPLPGLPWSPEFMSVYEAALAGQPLEIGSGRVKPGTMRALAVSFFNSSGFRSMKPITQRPTETSSNASARRLTGKAARTVIRAPQLCSVSMWSSSWPRVQINPRSANGLRKALRAMMKHAGRDRSAV